MYTEYYSPPINAYPRRRVREPYPMRRLRNRRLRRRAAALFSVTMSGGLVLGGTHPPSIRYLQSGGIILEGSFPVLTTNHDVTMSGGIVLGGTTTTSLGFGTVVMSGGIVLGGLGAGTVGWTARVTQSGGIVLGGSWDASNGIPMSGGIVLGGTWEVSMDRIECCPLPRRVDEECGRRARSPSSECEP